MQFIAMDAPKQGIPLVEIGNQATTLDLHNDALLRSVVYDYESRMLRLAWKIKLPAWKDPSSPEPETRPTIGVATLVLSGVRRFLVQGDLVETVKRDAGGLDFFEYSRLSPGVGEMRFVMENECEFQITGSRCELQFIAEEATD